MEREPRIDGRLAFVIPCAGSHALLLGACLDAIANSTVLPRRVFVGLSSVPDDLPLELRDPYPFEVHAVRTAGRRNAAENRNLAVDLLFDADEDEEIAFVSFIDADDLVHPHRSELLLAAFDRGAQAVVHDFVKMPFGFGAFLATDRRDTPCLPGHIDTFDDDLVGPVSRSGPVSFANGQVTVRAELLDLAHFPEDPEFAWCEDSLFTAALVSIGIPLDYLAGPLSVYRRRAFDPAPAPARGMTAPALAPAGAGDAGSMPVPEAAPVPRRIFCFWTGENPMSERRAEGLRVLRESAGVPVILVTPETLGEWVVEPLHPAYASLSLTHRADYLRAYVMHHHGGGYADIKPSAHDWRDHFAELDARPGALFSGYREQGPDAIAAPPGGEEIAGRFADLGGVCQFIVRPGTAFTRAWLDRVHAELDRALPALEACPGTYHPRAVAGGVHEDDTGGRFDGSCYPLEWNQLLGRILHPLMDEHRGRFLLSMPHPPTAGYR